MQVPRHFRGRAAVDSVDLITTRTGRGRIGQTLVIVVNVAVFVALAAIVFIDLGIAGNPLYHFVTVQGGSMFPAISRGDLILVAPAPAKVQPGMILVLRVGGETVTHRVVAANPDGTFVTRGDANSVDDAWGSQPVIVDGEYLATVPVLGPFLHIRSTSEASFADGVNAVMTITVGPFPTPMNLAATVRIEPQTIHLNGKGNGEITGFVDSLPAPHALSEIDDASLQLCYKGACIPSEGPAVFDGRAHVAAKFDPTALAGIVGTDSGDLTLVLKGTLRAGGTFSGRDVNHVIGGSPSGTIAPVDELPGDSIQPGTTDLPSPSDSTTTSKPPVLASDPPMPSPDPVVVVASPSPDPSSSPRPTAAPAPSASPDPTETLSPTAAAG